MFHTRWLKWLAVGCTFWAASASARADALNDTFDIFWELHWHQSGNLYWLRRWATPPEKTLYYSVNAGASASNRSRAVEALGTVLEVIGWKAEEVPEGDKRVQMEFTIRRFTDDQMRQYACFVQPQSNNGLMTKAKIELSEQWTYGCVLHEMMHAMGISGHPRGSTVLSYFRGNGQKLTDIDRFLLRTWYSNDIRAGMSPLQAARALNQSWIRETLAPDAQAAAVAQEQKWFDNNLRSLEAFAAGQGEPPVVLYRSGSINDAGIRAGKAQVQALLGWSYLTGSTLQPDSEKAAGYLLSAGKLGHFGATSVLMRYLNDGSLKTKAHKDVCEWARGVPKGEQGGNSKAYDDLLASKECAP